MGKRQGPRVRIAYAEPQATRPSTSVQIYRTSTGRLGNRVHIHQATDTDPIEDNPPEESSNPTVGQPTDTPWSETFFADNQESIIPQDLDEDSGTTNVHHAPQFLEDYLEYRQSLLTDIIQQDGRLGGRLCFECTAEEGVYRCKDCLYAVLFCASCIVEKHKRSPFHRIQVSSIPLILIYGLTHNMIAL